MGRGQRLDLFIMCCLPLGRSVVVHFSQTRVRFETSTSLVYHDLSLYTERVYPIAGFWPQNHLEQTPLSSGSARTDSTLQSPIGTSLTPAMLPDAVLP